MSGGKSLRLHVTAGRPRECDDVAIILVRNFAIESRYGIDVLGLRLQCGDQDANLARRHGVEARSCEHLRAGEYVSIFIKQRYAHDGREAARDCRVEEHT